MGPSFSSKNGVRYRFYVSTALRGRKQNAGSVTRVSAPEIEELTEAALSEKLQAPREEMLDHVERIIVSAGRIQVTLGNVHKRKSPIDIPWTPKLKGIAQVRLAPSEKKTDQKLLKSIVRAHARLGDLSEGHYGSVEELAAAANLHPKVIRQGLRLAFLAPAAIEVVLCGEASVELKQIPKLLPLSWREQISSMA
jgi:site-specific DNA recombinase